MNSSYSLIVRNRTPIIDPGESVEIELYLSGYGTPQRNKLVILWSLPQVIDKNNPGTLTSNIKLATEKNTGKIIQVVTGTQYSETVNTNNTGGTMHLHQGFFFDNPRYTQIPEYGLKGVISENKWDNEPPFLIKINTLNTAPSGDYDVNFIFTYGDNSEVKQDFKVIQFHITSWWERNQAWVTTLATIIAIVALLLTAIGTFYK